MKILLKMLVVVSLMSGTAYATENSQSKLEKICKVTNIQVNCVAECFTKNKLHCNDSPGMISHCKLSKKHLNCILKYVGNIL